MTSVSQSLFGIRTLDPLVIIIVIIRIKIFIIIIIMGGIIGNGQANCAYAVINDHGSSSIKRGQ